MDRLVGMRGDLYEQLIHDPAGNLLEQSQSPASGNTANVRGNRLTMHGDCHYEYDAFGRRIAKTNGLTRTEFLWQGDRLIAEETGDQYHTYIYEPDTFKPLALVDGCGPEQTSIYYYHLDHLGTPQELTNAQGDLVWSVTYRAYGNVVRALVNEIDNPIRFQGQYHDPETVWELSVLMPTTSVENRPIVLIPLGPGHLILLESSLRATDKVGLSSECR